MKRSLKLYVAYDKIREQPIVPCLAYTDAEACRSVLPAVFGHMPMKDAELRCYGDFDYNKFKTVVSWSVYSYPETQEQNLYDMGLSEEQVTQAMKQANSDKTLQDNISEVVNE